MCLFVSLNKTFASCVLGKQFIAIEPPSQINKSSNNWLLFEKYFDNRKNITENIIPDINGPTDIKNA